MAYSKLYKVITDSPVGFQTVNQFALNNDEMRTQMFVEHGDYESALALGSPPTAQGAGGLPFTYGYDWSSLGRHDITEVPKTVGQTFIYTAVSGGTAVGLNWTGPATLGVIRWATGTYILNVSGLPTFWAIVQPLGSGAGPLWADVRPFYLSTTSGGNAGLWIYTTNLSSGDFVATDMPFSFVIYGNV